MSKATDPYLEIEENLIARNIVNQKVSAVLARVNVRDETRQRESQSQFDGLVVLAIRRRKFNGPLGPNSAGLQLLGPLEAGLHATKQ